MRFISGHNTPRARDLSTSYRVDTNGCWLYTGYIDADGYGRIGRSEGPALAHRIYFEHHGGTLYDREIHHTCGVKACVNPAHLMPVTPAEHKRIEQEQRTHCRRGHPYAEYGRFHSGKTARYCAKCERENRRRRAALRR